MNGNNSSVPAFQPPASDLNFLASENGIYDYSNLYGFTKWLNRELTEYNFTETHPLLIVSESSDRLIFLIAAAFLLKIPVISLNPKSTTAELQKVLEHVSPEAVFTDQEKKFGDLPAPRINIPDASMQESDGWDSELFSLDNPEHVTGLFLTSGTTDSPKIVPIKRRQVFFAATASAENFKPDQNRYWLLCLPLNHIGGISIIYRTLLYQSAVYRMPSFEVNQVRAFLAENKLFQVASFVPTMLIQLLETPLFQVHKQFKALLLGGGPVSPDLIKQAETKGIPIVSSYGMTETCAQIAANAILKPSGMYIPKKSVGTIFPPNEIDIRDEAGFSVLPIESGQIWLRGPQVFDGYTDKNLNKQVFDEDDWFNTGDYGHINRLKQLFIENRRTDLIVTGGENVDPSDVESALKAIEGVKESAVIGITDKKWGQKVVAFIVGDSDEDLSEDTLRENLQPVLSSFKIPKEFLFIDELPKTGLGKINKDELKKSYRKLAKPVK